MLTSCSPLLTSTRLYAILLTMNQEPDGSQPAQPQSQPVPPVPASVPPAAPPATDASADAAAEMRRRFELGQRMICLTPSLKRRNQSEQGNQS